MFKLTLSGRPKILLPGFLPLPSNLLDRRWDPRQNYINDLVLGIVCVARKTDLDIRPLFP